MSQTPQGTRGKQLYSFPPRHFDSFPGAPPQPQMTAQAGGAFPSHFHNELIASFSDTKKAQSNLNPNISITSCVKHPPSPDRS